MRPVDTLDIVRRTGGRSIIPKFILVSEGYRTEVRYFEGLANNKRRAKISSLIQIYPLNRLAVHSGCSDPLCLLDLLDEYVDYSRTKKFSKNLFVSMFIEHAWDYLSEISFQHLDLIKAKMIKKLSKKYQGDIVDYKIATQICNDILEKESITISSDFVPPLPMDYDPDVDKIYVIIDRDRDARDTSKCKEFTGRCKKRRYIPILTNPCFEFWLLLHFEDIIHVNKKELTVNEKIDGKRFTERKLDEILKRFDLNGYSKTSFDTRWFIDRIDEAMYNEKMFCYEEKCIMSNIGSNVGSLIQEMRAPQIRK